MKQKYYAVKIGRNPGVYLTWDECREQVYGYPKATYKSFKTKEEALQFVESEMKSEQIRTDEIDVEVNEEEDLVAYVDGSYLKGDSYGSGCVFLYKGKVVATISKKYKDKKNATMRNVAGEIKGAELAMKYAIDHGYRKLVICYDYEGIAKWPLELWRPLKERTLEYKKFYDKIMLRNNITIGFKKIKSHSGDKYNDMADRLAKEALGV